MGKRVVKILNFLVLACEDLVSALKFEEHVAPGGLGLFPPADVDHDALELRRAILREADADEIAQPNHGPVGRQHAILEALMLLLGCELLAKSYRFLPIFGMDVVLPKARF